MRKLHTAVRIGALGALFVLICAVYLVVLVNVQITGQDYYDIIKEETTTRYVKIAAKRGEIYDTNGKAHQHHVKFNIKQMYNQLFMNGISCFMFFNN